MKYIVLSEKMTSRVDTSCSNLMYLSPTKLQSLLMNNDCIKWLLYAAAVHPVYIYIIWAAADFNFLRNADFTTAQTHDRKVPHYFPLPMDLSDTGMPTVQMTIYWCESDPGAAALSEQRVCVLIAVLPRAFIAAQIQTAKNSLVWECPFGF